MITVEVFTRPGCPHCPPTLNFMKQFARKHNLTLKHINTITTEGQILAQKFKVMAVPTVFIHSKVHPQRIGFRGKPSENDLEKALEVVKQPPQEQEKKPSFIKKLFKRK
jgi:glutaredoxin